jgi:pimeloyl-ACP methyl ester carboxylesterase
LLHESDIGGGGKELPKILNAKSRMNIPGLKASLTSRIIFPGLLFSVCCFCTIATGQTPSIIVHCLNPEGKEINSITGVNQTATGIYDGDTLIGYGCYDSATYNQPITLTAGAHTINVIFNGIELTQDINLVSGQQQVLTFVFTRRTWDFKAWIDGIGNINVSGSGTASNEGSGIESFLFSGSDNFSAGSYPQYNSGLYGSIEIGGGVVPPPIISVTLNASIEIDINAGGISQAITASISGPSDPAVQYNAYILQSPNPGPYGMYYSVLWYTSDVISDLQKSAFQAWYLQKNATSNYPRVGDQQSVVVIHKTSAPHPPRDFVTLNSSPTYQLSTIPANEAYEADMAPNPMFGITTGYPPPYLNCYYFSDPYVVEQNSVSAPFYFDGVFVSSVPYDLDGTAVGSDEGVMIVGVVNSACDGQPVPGASVQIGNVVTTSDNNGNYSIIGLSAGTYSAIVSQSNYFTITSSVTIPSGSSTVTDDFTLVPSSISITPLRLSSSSQANVSASDPIDAPIKPKADPDVLATASPLGRGVVADEVTPVLFSFAGIATNYTLEIIHDASAYTNGNLSDRLYVLQGNSWTQTTNLTGASTGSCTAFAYLEGLRWTDFNGTPANGVTLTVNVRPAGDSSVVASTNFLVRPPPIALVHGIADDNSTWSYGFTNTLAQYCPMDFIIPVQYGVGSGNNNTWPNAYGDFDALSVMLDDSLQQQFEAPLRTNWAFTRYDVVGHSQGGVLLRMLCQTDNTGFAPFSFDHIPVVSQDNFFRGRFRRVITIGSPHNGSLNLHYLIQMRNANSLIAKAIPAILNQFALPKFDPWGSQIKEINNPAIHVDPQIKFNCVITTIWNGWPPSLAANPICYAALGLCERQPGTVVTGGELLLPNGSDGVVDFASQGGGANTPGTRIDSSISISHADITKFGGAIQIFGVPPGHSQTTDSRVAQVVTNLLDGNDSAFGSFQLSTLLSPAQKTLADSIVPQLIMWDIIVALASPNIPTTGYSYALQLPVDVPAGGTAEWFVQVFGTNGISTDGVSLQVNTNDPNQVTVSVTNGVQGQVVLYATYAATNGILVFATPVVVVSNPVGTTLNGIELNPQSAALSPGDTLNTSIWGNYTSGMQSQLFIPDGQVQYTSSNPNIASVDSSGTITMNAFGTATVFANYNGFTAQVNISSTMPSISYFSGIGNTNRTFQLSFWGTVGTTNVIEASTNLINWVPIATLYNTNGFLQFLDVTASNYPIRFYRIKITNAGSTNIQPFVWISSQSGLTNGVFQFTLTGTAGVTNIIQTSTNLTTWTSLTTLMNTNGSILFLDQSATNTNQKFYRVMIPQ